MQVNRTSRRKGAEGVAPPADLGAGDGTRPSGANHHGNPRTVRGRRSTAAGPAGRAGRLGRAGAGAGRPGAFAGVRGAAAPGGPWRALGGELASGRSSLPGGDPWPVGTSPTPTDRGRAGPGAPLASTRTGSGSTGPGRPARSRSGRWVAGCSCSCRNLRLLCIRE